MCLRQLPLLRKLNSVKGDVLWSGLYVYFSPYFKLFPVFYNSKSILIILYCFCILFSLIQVVTGEGKINEQKLNIN